MALKADILKVKYIAYKYIKTSEGTAGKKLLTEKFQQQKRKEKEANQLSFLTLHSSNEKKIQLRATKIRQGGGIGIILKTESCKLFCNVCEEKSI